MSGMRYYETFYGIHTNDWKVDFGTFTDHNKILVKDYISEGCSTVANSTTTDTLKFIYPHHIAKKYFIEGVIQGHVTFASSGATSYINSYRVTVGKINEDNTDTELFSTGWITTEDELEWNSTYSIGEEVVYPFWIDAWDYEELEENERIYLKVQASCCDTSATCTDSSASKCTDTVLWHSNDATWEDIKIEIPFMGIQ